MPGKILDSSLSTWNEVREAQHWSGILIGNGASRAVWSKFEYPSIYSKAKDQGHLLREDIRLFDGMHFRNFEQILSALITTSKVLSALRLKAEVIDKHYAGIRRALALAIKEVHIPWEQALVQLASIRSALLDYEYIYSTNYDLLIYWAILQVEDGRPFVDYFWTDNHFFNPSDIKPRAESKKVLYLHGGLHLESLYLGGARKRVNDGRTLLDKFADPTEDDAVPLIVTEGTAEQKMKSIQSSAYLAFAMEQFVAHNGPLIIFGHSLSELDKHLQQAINSWNNRNLAISIFPGTDDIVIQQKARYIERLPGAVLSFFDSATHPLGNPALRVK